MKAIKRGFTVLAAVSFLAACSKSTPNGGTADLSSLKTAGVRASANKTAPSAVLSGPQAAMVGGTVSYSLTVANGIDASQATWNFGDGSPLIRGAGPLTHTYSQVGLRTVSVSFKDLEQNEIRISQTVDVVGFMDGMDCLNELALVGDGSATVGTPIDMRVNVPACLSRTVQSITWNWGDGSRLVTGLSSQHTYTQPGNATVTVVITTPFSEGAPWVTLTQVVTVDPIPAATPTPESTPVSTPTPVATPTPVPLCRLGETRTRYGREAGSQASCGVDGKKSVTSRERIVETCSVNDGAVAWRETSRNTEVVSEGSCVGQSCSLTGGGKLSSGETRVGITIGEVSSPKTCSFGEQVMSTYFEIADQTCINAQLALTHTRRGDLKLEGICPTYSWTATDSWSACTADCGGEHTRTFVCRNDRGEDQPAERCAGAPPTEVRICDGNPQAARKSESATISQDAGATQTCPANQIGVVISQRDVVTTTVFACIDHQIQKESESVVYGNWVTESYCRDYVAYRCSQDSLSNTEASGRYKWMLKCQDQVPVIKDFLASFDDVVLKGKGKDNFVARIEGKSRILYPTFMNRATNPEKVWKAPKSEGASCEVPPTAYVAAVCVSSCATPDQEILAQAEANLKMRNVPFVEALVKKYTFAATLSGGALHSRKMDRTRVDQWVTEMQDTEHDIRIFMMKSGGELKLTPNHPVVTAEGSMKMAESFKVGDSLVRFGGELDEIIRIDDVKYTGKVYNVFVKSADPLKNVVITNGYLNGTAYFQNEGTGDLNHKLLRDKLTRGIFGK